MNINDIRRKTKPPRVDRDNPFEIDPAERRPLTFSTHPSSGQIVVRRSDSWIVTEHYFEMMEMYLGVKGAAPYYSNFRSILSDIKSKVNNTSELCELLYAVMDIASLTTEARLFNEMMGAVRAAAGTRKGGKKSAQARWLESKAVRHAKYCASYEKHRNRGRSISAATAAAARENKVSSKTIQSARKKTGK